MERGVEEERALTFFYQDLHVLRVPELRSQLAARGLSIIGRKKVLQRRLRGALKKASTNRANIVASASTFSSSTIANITSSMNTSSNSGHSSNRSSGSSGSNNWNRETPCTSSTLLAQTGISPQPAVESIIHVIIHPFEICAKSCATQGYVFKIEGSRDVAYLQDRVLLRYTCASTAATVCHSACTSLCRSTSSATCRANCVTTPTLCTFQTCSSFHPPAGTRPTRAGNHSGWHCSMYPQENICLTHATL